MFSPIDVDELISFANEYEWILDGHGVRYFTHEKEAQIPQDWLEFLVTKLSEIQLYLLPCTLDHGMENAPPSLLSFLKRCRELSLPNEMKSNLGEELFCFASASNINKQIIGPVNEFELYSQLTQAMSPKKRHETERMAHLIYLESVRTGCSSVLDLGCGQGYLMQILAFYYKLDVIGVDSSKHQVEGTMKRARESRKRLELSITKLNNPENVSQKVNLEPIITTIVLPISTIITMSQIAEEFEKQQCLTAPSFPASDSISDFNSVNAKITNTKKKKKINSRDFTIPADFRPLKSSKGVILVGLHTCGDLAASTLNLFFESQSVKTLINVGCCYNLMNECKRQEDWKKVKGNGVEIKPTSSMESSNSESTNVKIECDCNYCRSGHGSYPLSKPFQAKLPFLGRTVRNLGCQSVSKRPHHVRRSESGTNINRAEEGNFQQYQEEEEVDLPVQLVHKSQVFRATLQVIYEKDYHLFDNLYSGPAPHSKLDKFSNYAKHILQKQGLELKLNDLQLEQRWKEWGEPHYMKLVAYDSLRASLAPIVETIILMDRLKFLEEKSVETGIPITAQLAPIFDPTISPRNFAIIARK